MPKMPFDPSAHLPRLRLEPAGRESTPAGLGADEETYYARHHYEPRVQRALELLATRGEFCDPTSLMNEADQYCGRCHDE